MNVYVVLAHPEHQSFNGAMFRTGGGDVRLSGG